MTVEEQGAELPDMPSPTQEQLASPEFQAVWEVIRSWDVNVPEFYSGYCAASGSHVALILDALASVQSRGHPDTLARVERLEGALEASGLWDGR